MRPDQPITLSMLGLLRFAIPFAALSPTLLMPRRTQSSKAPSKSRSKQTKNKASALPLPSLPKGLRAWLRLITRKSRDLAIGFGLITALSFIPPSVTEQWGPNAQRAVVLAGELRAADRRGLPRLRAAPQAGLASHRFMSSSVAAVLRRKALQMRVKALVGLADQLCVEPFPWYACLISSNQQNRPAPRVERETDAPNAIVGIKTQCLHVRMPGPLQSVCARAAELRAKRFQKFRVCEQLVLNGCGQLPKFIPYLIPPVAQAGCHG